MTSPMLDQPCETWPLDTSCLPDDWDPDALTPEQMFALQVATELLWRLSGGRYGLCEITVRPCRKRCTGSFNFGLYGGLQPYVYGGQWLNAGCSCDSDCGCGPICEIALPGPVDSIVSVVVDGVTLAPDSYRVDNAKWLVRVGQTSDCWPECQHLELPPTEVGTFAVTYNKGIPVPPAGIRAVTAYALEIWKACVGAGGCRLPSRVTDITREGVTMTMMDPLDFLKDGLTGIPEVDIWLTAVNPYGQRDQSRMYSPRRSAPRRQTWPA